MKVSLVFTNVVGNQPKPIEVESIFQDFAKDRLELHKLSREDGKMVFKKVWPDDKKKVQVRASVINAYRTSEEIDLILPISILEFFKVTV